MPTLFVIFFIVMLNYSTCVYQNGPDPWNYENNEDSTLSVNDVIPPDLKLQSNRKRVPEFNVGLGEWFFRRILAVVLKGGHVMTTEDGNVQINMELKFDKRRWETLGQYLSSNDGLSEEMFRRSVGYVEDAIQKPSFAETVVLTWINYIQMFVEEYKMYITWTFSLLAVLAVFVLLWRHMCHKHLIIIIFVLLYMYEAFISYKEAERKEYDIFMSSVNKCKWYFWTSSCDVPAPDPLIFIKHMNPLKIAIRMFTTVVSEPMITISEIMKTVFHDVTDGLMFPFDRIAYGLLHLSFNVLLVIILIMIIFNYILNISFNIKFFAGLLSFGTKERKRTLNLDNDKQHGLAVDNGERISGATLHKILDFCSRAQNNTQTVGVEESIKSIKLTRSASTGRLSECLRITDNLAQGSGLKEKSTIVVPNGSGLKKRHRIYNGSGDH